jgi:hypothetical protein
VPGQNSDANIYGVPAPGQGEDVRRNIYGQCHLSTIVLTRTGGWVIESQSDGMFRKGSREEHCGVSLGINYVASRA